MAGQTGPIDKDEFLKQYLSQKSRAMSIIKTLKSVSHQKKVNFELRTKISLTDNSVSIKNEILELPTTKFVREEADTDEEFYQVVSFESIED